MRCALPRDLRVRRIRELTQQICERLFGDPALAASSRKLRDPPQGFGAQRATSTGERAILR
jgi:hypothetical protein